MATDEAPGSVEDEARRRSGARGPLLPFALAVGTSAAVVLVGLLFGFGRKDWSARQFLALREAAFLFPVLIVATFAVFHLWMTTAAGHVRGVANSGSGSRRGSVGDAVGGSASVTLWRGRHWFEPSTAIITRPTLPAPIVFQQSFDMARLADIPAVVRVVGVRPFAKRVWHEVLDDHLFVFAGSLAYAWLFAIFPFFLFLLNLIPFLPLEDRPSAFAEIEVFLKALLPDLAAETLLGSVRGAIEAALRPAADRSAVEAAGSVLRLAGSLAVALWAASGGIAVTMAALDKCYEIDRPRAFYKRRPMAFGLTAATAGLVCVVILLLPVGTAFKSWALQSLYWEVSYWAIWAFDVVRGGLAVAAAFAFLSLLYHFGPCVKHKYRSVTPGAAFTLVCWVVIGIAFREYVARFGGKYHQTYGPVGGVAVLLLLFYLDAVVLLIGAEINSEIDFEILKVPRGSQNFTGAELRARRWRFRRRRKKESDAPPETTCAAAPRDEPVVAQGAD